MSWMQRAREHAAAVFGGDFEEIGEGVLQGHCPARSRHGNKSGAKDCRVFLAYSDGKKPGAYCLHSSCLEELGELNREFRDRLFPDKKGQAAGGSGGGERTRGRAAPPKLKVDRKAVAAAQQDYLEGAKWVPWLYERSPVDPGEMTPGEFLDHLFNPGERVLCFYNFFSQGDYGHVAGRPAGQGKTWKLPRGRAGEPEPAQFPRADRVGAWFLPAPVDGEWHPTGTVDDNGQPVLSRRTFRSVVEHRYLLLESDELEPEPWLNIICARALPVGALYTSGGRSVHALIRVDAQSKGAFDEFVRRLKPYVTLLGADPGAMKAVNLTRLPGVYRQGKEKGRQYERYKRPRLQRLLYLNPAPEVVPIKTLRRLRIHPSNAGV